MAVSPPPKKRLGQHFLVDPNIVRKIVAVAALQPHETVLEIGPGRGMLTRALCQQAKHVMAIEVDRSLAPALEEHLAGCDNVTLHFGDALQYPYATMPMGTVVVANLPYNISSPLMFRLLDAHARFDRMVLMLQAEVATRMAAKPGTKDYGILSVLTQYRAKPAVAFRVSPGCFRPKPAVVTLEMRRQPAVSVEDEATFVRTVRASFAHRRKTLANSLRDEGFLPDRIAYALHAAHIQPIQRAETLGLEAFAALANALSELKG